MKTKIAECKTIATTVAIILLGATPALADGAYEIYTYGSGDFVAQVLRGVALVMSGGYIQTLIKVVLLVGLLTALLNPITSWLSSGGARPGDGGTGGEGFIAILRQVLLAVVVMYLFIVPKANVAIIDRYDSSQSQVVSDVPFIQAIIAHGASMVGDVIGREMEAAFNLPDAMTFRSGGLGVGVKHINNIYNILPPGPDMDTTTYSNLTLVSISLREYFNNCVYPNFATLDGPTGPKTSALRDLAQSKDIFATLETHKTLFGDSAKPITAPTTSGSATCAEAPAIIKNVWDAGKTPWIQHIEKESQNGISAIVLQRYFPNGGDYFTMLQTIATGNIMRSTLRGFEAKNAGNASQIAGDQALASTVGGWQTTAKMFEKIVHVMRNVFEGLIYGLSVFLPVAIAVAGFKPVGMYMKIVLWLQLWVPFYVLLNLFGDMELARTLSALSIENDGSFPTLAAWKDVGEKAQTSLAYLGSLSFTIPMFAWGLLQGGGYAMSSAMHSMSGSGATAAAQRVGSSAGLDSLQYGNRSTNSYSDKSGTAFGAQFNYERTLGGQSGASSVIAGTGKSTAAFYNQHEQLNTSQIAGGMSKLTNMDKFVTGQASAEKAVGDAHGLFNAAHATNMSMRELSAAGTTMDQTQKGAKYMGERARGADPVKVAAAEGDMAAARGVAESTQTPDKRDTRAQTAVDHDYGSAKGKVDAAGLYGVSVDELSRNSALYNDVNNNARYVRHSKIAGGEEKLPTFTESLHGVINRATGSGKETAAFDANGRKVFSDKSSGSNSTNYEGSTKTVRGNQVDYQGAGKEGTAERAAWNAIEAKNQGNTKGYRAETKNLAEAIVGKGPNAMERVLGDRGNLEVLKQTVSNAAERYGKQTGQDRSYTTLSANVSGEVGGQFHTKDLFAGKVFNVATGGDLYAKASAGARAETGSQGSSTVQTEDMKKGIHAKVEQIVADNTNYPTAQAKMEGIMGYATEVSNKIIEAGGKTEFQKATHDTNPIHMQNNEDSGKQQLSKSLHTASNGAQNEALNSSKSKIDNVLSTMAPPEAILAQQTGQAGKSTPTKSQDTAPNTKGSSKRK